MLLSFARTDVRLVSRDAVSAVLLASPLVLGLSLRLGFPPLERWVAAEHGVALAPHRPLFALLLVVLHVPFTYGIVGGLLVLDDADDRVLTALRVSPLTLERYLAYRLATMTALGAAGLAVAAPLSGLVALDGDRLGPALATLALAVLLVPVVALTVVAVAGSRVEGVLAVKALGIPLYLPLVPAYLPPVAGTAATAALAWLPSTWVVLAGREAAQGRAAWWAVAAGLVVTGLVLRLTWRLGVARLTRPDRTP